MTVNASSSASNATPAPTNAPSPGLSQLYIDLTTLFFSLIILAGLFGNSLVMATPGGGYSANFWAGVCRWDSETLTLN